MSSPVVKTAGFEALSADDLGPALPRQAPVALWTALADLGGVWTLEQVTGRTDRPCRPGHRSCLARPVAAERARGKLPETGADAGGIVALAMGKMGAGN